MQLSPQSKALLEASAMEGGALPYKPPVIWAHGVLHWSLTAVLIYIGIDCLLPGSMMTAANGWSYFLRWHDEQSWGIIFIILGCIGLIGTETPRTWLRIFSVLILATTHILMAGMFIAASVNSAGIGLFSIFAAQGYYLLYRYTRRTHA